MDLAFFKLAQASVTSRWRFRLLLALCLFLGIVGSLTSLWLLGLLVIAAGQLAFARPLLAFQDTEELFRAVAISFLTYIFMLVWLAVGLRFVITGGAA